MDPRKKPAEDTPPAYEATTPGSDAASQGSNAPPPPYEPSNEQENNAYIVRLPDEKDGKNVSVKLSGVTGVIKPAEIAKLVSHMATQGLEFDYIDSITEEQEQTNNYGYVVRYCNIDGGQMEFNSITIPQRDLDLTPAVPIEPGNLPAAVSYLAEDFPMPSAPPPPKEEWKPSTTNSFGLNIMAQVEEFDRDHRTNILEITESFGQDMITEGWGEQKRNEEQLRVSHALGLKRQAIIAKLKKHEENISLLEEKKSNTAQRAAEAGQGILDAFERTVLLNSIIKYRNSIILNQKSKMITLANALNNTLGLEIKQEDLYNDKFLIETLQKKSAEEISLCVVELMSQLGESHDFIKNYKDTKKIEKAKRTTVFEYQRDNKLEETLEQAATADIEAHENPIKQDIEEYKKTIEEHEAFLRKQPLDFKAVQKLRSQATSLNEGMTEYFSSFRTTANRAYDAITYRRSEIDKLLRLTPEPESEKFHSDMTQDMITRQKEALEEQIIQAEQEVKAIQDELARKLNIPGISLEDAKEYRSKARTERSAITDKIDGSIKVWEEITEEMHNAAKRLGEQFKQEKEGRRQMHDALKSILLGEDMEFWRTKRSIWGGKHVLNNQGKEISVPRGIAEMIILLDPTREPASIFSMKPTALSKERLTDDEIEAQLQTLVSIAIERRVDRDSMGRTGSSMGRRDRTTDELYQEIESWSRTMIPGKPDYVQNLNTATTRLQKFKTGIAQELRREQTPSETVKPSLLGRPLKQVTPQPAEDAASLEQNCQKLYKAMNESLSGENVSYWTLQQNQTAGGTRVRNPRGKIVHVPTGIGKMMIELDPDATKPRNWSPARLFQAKTNSQPTEVKQPSFDEIKRKVVILQQIARERLTERDWKGGSGEKHGSRRTLTDDFYLNILRLDLNNPQSVAKCIKFFEHHQQEIANIRKAEHPGSQRYTRFNNR